MIAANIDYLVLGCSHYPYLIPQIKKYSQSTLNHRLWWAVAKQTQNVLKTKVGFSTQQKITNLFIQIQNPTVLKEIVEMHTPLKKKILEKTILRL
jgi:glutamate racemase